MCYMDLHGVGVSPAPQCLCIFWIQVLAGSLCTRLQLPLLGDIGEDLGDLGLSYLSSESCFQVVFRMAAVAVAAVAAASFKSGSISAKLSSNSMEAISSSCANFKAFKAAPGGMLCSKDLNTFPNKWLEPIASARAAATFAFVPPPYQPDLHPTKLSKAIGQTLYHLQ